VIAATLPLLAIGLPVSGIFPGVDVATLSIPCKNPSGFELIVLSPIYVEKA